MIEVELNQQLLRGGQRIPRAVLQSVLVAVSRELGVKSRKQVSVVFVPPRTMKQLNKSYRGKDYVTDVLSFSLGDDPLFGELVLSYDQAKKQAAEQKHSVRDELVFLIVHGMLHLFGYDHERPSDARVMFPIQERLLKKLHVNPAL